MPSDALTQLGLGGIFAILVIRMVLEFLGKRKNGPENVTGAGEQSIEFWREQNRATFADVITPLMQRQTLILESLDRNAERHDQWERDMLGRIGNDVAVMKDRLPGRAS